MRHAVRSAAAFLFAASLLSSAAAAPRIEVTPYEFDFGWAPDNAKIVAVYTVRNTSGEMVPLTAVKPTCGCTATDFEPDGLASQEEKKIFLTFNTRGYGGDTFRKMAQVKTDMPDQSATVYLLGYVSKPDNGLMPDSDGIAGFEPKSESKKKVINLTNKTKGELALTVVQEPAGWARVKVSNKPIAPGASAPVEISVDGPLDQERFTSVTLAPAATPNENRVTLAIRTGPPPAPYRRPQAPAPTPPAKKSEPKGETAAPKTK